MDIPGAGSHPGSECESTPHFVSDLSEAEVQRQVARLQGILDERARRRAEDFRQRVRNIIVQDREKIETGTLEIHECTPCLEGYCSGDIARFCEEGRRYVLKRAGG